MLLPLLLLCVAATNAAHANSPHLHFDHAPLFHPRGLTANPDAVATDSADDFAHGPEHGTHPRPRPAQPLAAINHVVRAFRRGQGVQEAIDRLEAFSMAHGLGLTLGEEKGRILERATIQATKSATFRNEQGREVFLAVEMGSHIGDGTLRILKPLLEWVAVPGTQRDCVIVSLEANNEWLAAGAVLIRHVLEASPDHACSYLPMHIPADMAHLSEAIRANIGSSSQPGLVFMDHDHSRFKQDLHELVTANFVRANTVIVADNALRHKDLMGNFAEYVQSVSEDSMLVRVNEPYIDDVLVATYSPIEYDEL